MRRRVEVLAKRVLQGSGSRAERETEGEREDDEGGGDQHPPSEQEGAGGGKEKGSKTKVRVKNEYMLCTPAPFYLVVSV